MTICHSYCWPYPNNMTFPLSLHCFLQVMEFIFFCMFNCYLLLVNCVKVSEARSLDRDVVENGLTFAGFVVIIQTLSIFVSSVHLFSIVLFCYVSNFFLLVVSVSSWSNFFQQFLIQIITITMVIILIRKTINKYKIEGFCSCCSSLYMIANY